MTKDLVVSGFSYVAPEGLSRDGLPTTMETRIDAIPFLKDRKSLKMMSKQDQLSLIVASKAVQMAKIPTNELELETGIYLAIGVLPFEDKQIDILEKLSSKDGVFDVEFSSVNAFQALNPLLTFKCLPNMPVYHTSYNLGIRGRYFVTYPGAGQWYLALQEAIRDLSAGRVKHAIVGAAADQRNVLVRHHMERVLPDRLDHLIDAAGVIVVSRGDSGVAALGRVKSLEVSYIALDPMVQPPNVPTLLKSYAGPADPVLAVALDLEAQNKGPKEYSVSTQDGISASLSIDISAEIL